MIPLGCESTDWHTEVRIVVECARGKRVYRRYREFESRTLRQINRFTPMHERETSEQAYDEAMAIQRAAQEGAARKAFQRGERQSTAIPDKADYSEANLYIDALVHLGEKGVLQVENLADEMNVIHELGQEKGEVVVGLWKAMIMERQRIFSVITQQARERFTGVAKRS